MKSLLTIIFVISSFCLFAQHHDHDHHVNHFGVGVGITSFISEDHADPGFHLHYMRRFHDHSPLSIGLGYEAITGEHLHHTISTLIGYSPVNGLSIKVGPGITFAEGEEHSESSLSGHFELMYEFELSNFHLGPMIGYGVDAEESHLAFGVHFGIGF